MLHLPGAVLHDTLLAPGAAIHCAEEHAAASYRTEVHEAGDQWIADASSALHTQSAATVDMCTLPLGYNQHILKP